MKESGIEAFGVARCRIRDWPEEADCGCSEFQRMYFLSMEISICCLVPGDDGNPFDLTRSRAMPFD